jgi:hypothetical protein
MESQTEKEVLQEQIRRWFKKAHNPKRVPVVIRKKVEIMCVKCGRTWAKNDDEDLSCSHCRG